MTKILAIASCRVSSEEQLKNNSLSRQEQAVEEAATKLNANLVRIWSGDASSKNGKNLSRKDLQEMLDFCRKSRAIKYLILDEPDRFKRSVEEAMYFEVEFKKLGVKVWYACDDELNSDNMQAKLMKFMKYFVAEGSNEERQRKSINGLTKAIQEGRYPFPPPIGYRRGLNAGLHEIDPVMGPLIKILLTGVASSIMSPSDAVRTFNESEQIHTSKRCSYKLDKLRLILTNPYYAGVIEMNKQVQCRNEHGLHEPMITKAQHEMLVKIVNGKTKNQKGTRKNGNPKYIMNGARCSACDDERLGRLVGFDHTNGKTSKVYERYRCRNCGAYNRMDNLHPQGMSRLNKLRLTQPIRQDFIEVMSHVWQKQEENNASEKATMSNQIIELEKQLDNQAAAIANPANDFIRERLEKAYTEKLGVLESIKEKRANIDKLKATDKERFLKFALDFVDNLGASYFDNLTPEKRQVCKQILFPGGFYVSTHGEVYTPEISSIYRLLTNKKDLPVTEKSLLVRVQGL